MSEKKRNKFTAQFKAKVALETIRGDKMLNEIGIEFGRHPSQVVLWKRELLENAPYQARALPVTLRTKKASGTKRT